MYKHWVQNGPKFMLEQLNNSDYKICDGYTVCMQYSMLRTL